MSVVLHVDGQRVSRDVYAHRLFIEREVFGRSVEEVRGRHRNLLSAAPMRTGRGYALLCGRLCG